MIKKILLMTMVAGSLTVMTQSNAVAGSNCVGGSGSGFVCSTGADQTGSTSLGFDPSAVTAAALNRDASTGACFTCANTTLTSGGTTAGALTNSMFGAIRLNSEADLGELSYNPTAQGMTVPNSSECGTGCNDSGAFSFDLPPVVNNFTGDGGEAANAADPVATGGVKITFSNSFTFAADGVTSFDQKLSQETFIGGLAGNDIQMFSADAKALANPASPLIAQGGGRIDWEQTIKDGGFDLGLQAGFFEYNNSTFDAASAPTGAGQSTGTNTVIGQ